MIGNKPLDGWALSLLAVAKENPIDEVDAAQATKIHFDRIFEERRRKRPSTLKKIPRFYAPRPAPIGASRADVDEAASEETRMAKARSIIRAKARSRFIQRQTNAVPDFEEMLEVERALTATTTPKAMETETEGGLPKSMINDDGGEDAGGSEGKSKKMDYIDFLGVRNMVPEKTQQFFKTSSFIRFPRDHRGRISTPMFLASMYRTHAYQKTLLSLQRYDHNGYGYMKEEDLQRYISNHVPFTAALEGMPEAFRTQYVKTAARRFMFFLDPKRTGKIALDSLAQSHVMGEFRELRMSDPRIGYEGMKTWFSAENVMRIYEEFMELDVDRNGLLSQEELLHFGWQNVRLTPMTVENLLKAGKMDYVAFVDLVLYLENRETRQTLRYLWRVLDVEGTGRLTPEIIGRFYRDVADILEMGEAEVPQVTHVENELFDMVKPKHPAFITFSDLLASGVGSTVATMLLDANGFLLNEHRESFINTPDKESFAAYLSALLPRPPVPTPRTYQPQ